MAFAMFSSKSKRDFILPLLNNTIEKYHIPLLNLFCEAKYISKPPVRPAAIEWNRLIMLLYCNILSLSVLVLSHSILVFFYFRFWNQHRNCVCFYCKPSAQYYMNSNSAEFHSRHVSIF